MHYAAITRREQEEANALLLASRGPSTIKGLIRDRLPFGKAASAETSKPPTVVGDAAASEKVGSGLAEKADAAAHHADNGDAIITGVTDAEWKEASRAMRTAGWGGVFYLIVTEILGPSSAPYVPLLLDFRRGERHAD